MYHSTGSLVPVYRHVQVPSQIIGVLTDPPACPGTGIGIDCTALSDGLTGSSHLLSFRPWTLPSSGFIVPAFRECVRSHRPAGRSKALFGEKAAMIYAGGLKCQCTGLLTTRRRAGASSRNYPEVFAGRPCHSMVFDGKRRATPAPRLRCRKQIQKKGRDKWTEVETKHMQVQELDNMRGKERRGEERRIVEPEQGESVDPDRIKEKEKNKRERKKEREGKKSGWTSH